MWSNFTRIFLKRTFNLPNQLIEQVCAYIFFFSVSAPLPFCKPYNKPMKNYESNLISWSTDVPILYKSEVTSPSSPLLKRVCVSVQNVIFWALFCFGMYICASKGLFNVKLEGCCECKSVGGICGWDRCGWHWPLPYPCLHAWLEGRSSWEMNSSGIQRETPSRCNGCECWTLSLMVHQHTFIWSANQRSHTKAAITSL